MWMWFAGVLGVIFIIGLVFIVKFISIFAFQSQRTEKEIKRSVEYELLNPNVDIEELTPLAEPLPNRYIENQLASTQSKAWLLTPENTLIQGTRYLDEDPNKEVTYLAEKNWVILEDAIKRIDDGKLGEVVHRFGHPFRHINNAIAINDNTFLIYADEGKEAYVQTKGWVVNSDTFEMQLIDEDPYYLFYRLPMVVKADKDITFLMYYSGSLSFSFGGGDSSAPKYSTLRIFDRQNSMGKDLLRTTLKAGTIEKVEWVNDAWVVTTDPSLPSVANKPRVPGRRWRVNWSELGE